MRGKSFKRNEKVAQEILEYIGFVKMMTLSKFIFLIPICTVKISKGGGTFGDVAEKNKIFFVLMLRGCFPLNRLICQIVMFIAI